MNDMVTPQTPSAFDQIIKILVDEVVRRTCADPDLRAFIKQSVAEECASSAPSIADYVLDSNGFSDAVLETIQSNGAKLSRWVESCQDFRWLHDLGKDSGDPTGVYEAIEEHLKGLRLNISLSNVEMEIEDIVGPGG